MFDDETDCARAGARDQLAEQAVVLRGYALARATRLLAAVRIIQSTAPFRLMTTPGGQAMSAAQTNCGDLGWVSDARGYRYVPSDPASGRHWPPMPDTFRTLAREAAATAGFDRYEPDACLINCYVPGARLSLHQDKDERDHTAPIVSVSLGIPCWFLFGGIRRGDRPARIPLFHGDVVVWGGLDRMRYHGVAPVPEASHPLLGARRINLTFRRTGRPH
ncbi:MAG: DNA oxidative demethylase AlkB [Candidimonas sp.]|nr:MAG: DNA oxidative demethylase AlkB [Candidimonas sp.]